MLTICEKYAIQKLIDDDPVYKEYQKVLNDLKILKTDPVKFFSTLEDLAIVLRAQLKQHPETSLRHL